MQLDDVPWVPFAGVLNVPNGQHLIDTFPAVCPGMVDPVCIMRSAHEPRIYFVNDPCNGYCWAEVDAMELQCYLFEFMSMPAGKSACEELAGS